MSWIFEVNYYTKNKNLLNIHCQEILSLDLTSLKCSLLINHLCIYTVQMLSSFHFHPAITLWFRFTSYITCFLFLFSLSLSLSLLFPYMVSNSSHWRTFAQFMLRNFVIPHAQLTTCILSLTNPVNQVF